MAFKPVEGGPPPPPGGDVIACLDTKRDRIYSTDGVHPASKARDIFVKEYWDSLMADPVAQGWMFQVKPQAGLTERGR